MLWQNDTRYLEALSAILITEEIDNGLLHARRDYQASGIPACIHDTFGNPTTLLSFHLSKAPQYKSLQHDNAYGVKYFQDIRTWLVAEGSWHPRVPVLMATEYKVKDWPNGEKSVYFCLCCIGKDSPCFCRYNKPVML